MKTATLEQSKKINELVIKFEIAESKTLTWGKDPYGKWYVGRWQEQDYYISAPTAEEAANELPSYVESKGTVFYLVIRKGKNHYSVQYESSHDLLMTMTAISLVVALTNMLIWLKEK